MMAKKRKIEKFITKADFKKTLNMLLKDTLLIGPIKSYGDILFQKAESIETIAFDYENCLNMPKDFLLLNDEPLFKYDIKRLNVKEGGPDRPEVVIFGSRACDTKAVGLLDKFFTRKFEDPLYLGKRKNTLIITLMCQKLSKNCFCTSTHSGPYLLDGFDIQLVDIDTGFFVEAASSKGRDFVKRFSNLMKDVDADKRKMKEEAVKKAIDSKGLDFDQKKVYRNLDRLNTKDELWQDLAQRCQSCGGCLLICPTCSCFYVIDKKLNDKEGARVRCLDACFYEGLTRMSGGYNPVSPRDVMMRRKFYHKLWQQLDEFGESGCTGCGRCNEICPGNINWLDVIKRVEKIAV